MRYTLVRSFPTAASHCKILTSQIALDKLLTPMVTFVVIIARQPTRRPAVRTFACRQPFAQTEPPIPFHLSPQPVNTFAPVCHLTSPPTPAVSTRSAHFPSPRHTASSQHTAQPPFTRLSRTPPAGSAAQRFQAFLPAPLTPYPPIISRTPSPNSFAHTDFRKTGGALHSVHNPSVQLRPAVRFACNDRCRIAHLQPARHTRHHPVLAFDFQLSTFDLFLSEFAILNFTP